MVARRRNWLLVAMAILVLGAGGYLASGWVRPPVRCVVFVMNTAQEDLAVEVGDAATVRLAPGQWRRFDVPARTKEQVQLVLTGGWREPLRCAVGNGIHLA